MNKLAPIKKVDISKIDVKGSVEVHASRLASFKSTVSRYNKDNKATYKFTYGEFKNDYCTVTRIS